MKAKIASKINNIKTTCYSDFTCTSLDLNQIIFGHLIKHIFFSHAVSTPGQKAINIKISWNAETDVKGETIRNVDILMITDELVIFSVRKKNT